MIDNISDQKADNEKSIKELHGYFNDAPNLKFTIQLGPDPVCDLDKLIEKLDQPKAV